MTLSLYVLRSLFALLFRCGWITHTLTHDRFRFRGFTRYFGFTYVEGDYSLVTPSSLSLSSFHFTGSVAACARKSPTTASASSSVNTRPSFTHG